MNDVRPFARAGLGVRRARTVLALAVIVGCSEHASSAAPARSSGVSSPVGLKFVQQPAGALAGQPMRPSLVVAVVDAAGNNVPVSALIVTITARTATASVSIRGTVSVATKAGIAVFDDVAVTQPASEVSLIASAPGIAGVTSARFDVDPGATIVDSTKMSLLSDSVSVARGELAFNAGGQETPAAPGTVLVGTQGGGFVQRVVSGERVGSTLRYATAPASLDEVIANDSIVVHLALPNASGALPKNVVGAMRNAPPKFVPANAAIVGVGKEYSVTGMVLFGSETVGAVVKSGVLKLNLEPDLKVTFGYRGVKSARVAVSGTVDFDGVLTVGFERGVSRHGSLLLGELEMPFLVNVGIVPIIGRFRIPVTLEWNIDIHGQARIQFSWTSTATTDIGAEWLPSTGWSPLQTARFSFVPALDADISAGATTRLGIQAAPQLLLDYALSAGLRMQPYAELSGTVDVDANSFAMSCRSAVSLGLDVDFSIFGRGLAAFSRSIDAVPTTWPACDKSGSLVAPSPIADDDPQIDAIDPDPTVESAEPQAIRIAGANFALSGAIVRLRDLTHGGTVDKTPATATATTLVVSAKLTKAGTWSAEVLNPDHRTSGQFSFTVRPPPAVQAPRITSISPNPVAGSAASQTLVVTGSGFVSGAIVRIRDLSTTTSTDRTPSALGPSQLEVTVVVPTTSTSWSIEVVNPDGRSSGEVRLIVTNGSAGSNPAPRVTAVAPNPVSLTGGQQSLALSGADFLAGAIVRLEDAGRGLRYDNTPFALTPTRLEVAANLGSANGNWSATVVNPDGRASNAVPFVTMASDRASDLIIQSFSVSPNSGEAGSSATLTLVIKNQGAGTAAASTTNVRLTESSTTVTTSDPLLAQLTIPSVAAGGIYTATSRVTLPSGHSPGVKYIWATLDVNDVAGQSNTNNDRASTPFTINGATAPDLVVQSLSVNPTNGTAGSAAVLTLVIKNQGTSSAAPSLTNVRLSTSGTSVTTNDPLLAQLSIPSIMAGATYTVTSTVTIPTGRSPGQNYAWVTLDINNVAGQSNTANDQGATPFTVTSATMSDLVIQSLSVSPTSGQAASTATVTLVIKNQGTGTAAASTTNVRLSTSSTTVTTSDPLLVQLTIPSLVAGATYTATPAVTIPSGRATGQNHVWVTLDVNNVAGQSDTNNDRASTPFTITGPSASDLVVQSFSVSPTSGQAGSSLTLTLVIKNQGIGTAAPSTTNLRLSTSGTAVTTNDPLLGQLSIPSIAAGATFTVTPTVMVPSGRAAGQNYAWVTLDIDNVAGQSNTNNDQAATPFTVTGAIASDLVVQSLSVSPISGQPTSAASVILTIRNQGAGAAAASTTNIRLSASSSTVTTSDPLLVQLSIPSIAAGATYTATPTITIPIGRVAGVNYVWATLDINNVAGQSNTTNDQASTPFTVIGAGASDLVVQSLSVNPTSGPGGGTATVTLVIKNQGTSIATGSTTNIRLSTSNTTVTTSDPLLAQLSVPSIAAGATYTSTPTVTIPSARAPGQNYVWVTLDVNNIAGQSNTNNDQANAPFTVSLTPTGRSR